MRWDISIRHYRRALLVWGVALMVGSLQPHRTKLHRVPTAHSIFHILAFGMLTFLAGKAFPGRRSLFWIAPACLLLGVLLEIAQHQLSERALEWADIRDDAVAIGLVSCVCWAANPSSSRAR